jgi:copper chaperone NosL
MRRASVRLPLLALVLVAACADGPREIRLGEEACAHCSMVISDDRFAAQLITDRGRSLAYDDVACLLAAELAAAATGDATLQSSRGRWIADFDAPGAWLPVEAAVFLKSGALRTPMGGGLSAHATAEAAAALQATHGGAIMDWAEVRRTAPGRQDDHAHAH